MAGKTGKGKITRGNAAGGSRKKSVTGQAKAGLVFSVGRIARFLKQGRYSDRFGRSGAVFLAGVLEYLCNEVLELAGNAAEEHKKKTI
jgi:histone H2A